MTPSPLPPSVLHILLQYISPPSELTQPIPPHLLSKPLLQRHHFLSITPDTPDDYLCWSPSPEKKARAVELLESRPRPIDDDQPAAHPVQYSFDGEDFFAHVDTSCGTGDGPMIVLQWDEHGDWRYHNVDLMPFPPGSRPSLEDVLIPPPLSVPVQTRPTPPLVLGFDPGFVDEDDGGDDDDYWNAYGSTDIGDSAYSDGGPTSAKDAQSSEDAYWAQYASVQGTADSTIPSPVHPNRRKLHPFTPTGDVASKDPLVSMTSQERSEFSGQSLLSFLPRPNQSRWDPADPTALSRLLSTISPRENALSSPVLDDAFDADEVLSSPTIGDSNDSDSASSSGLGLQGTDISLATNLAGDNPRAVMWLLEDGSVPNEKTPAREVEDEDEMELEMALAGVWRMWKKSKKKSGAAASGDNEAAEVFLRTARAVVVGKA